MAAPGTPKRPIRNNQYGFSTGGPIVRNKAFFFTTLEIQKLTAGNTIPTTAPSNAWVANATQLLNQFNVPVNPVAVNMLALWPQESRTGPAIAQNFMSTDNNTYDSANGIFKIDQQFNEKYGLSSRYFGGGGDQVATGTYGTLARNALYGPGFRTVDLSLFKTTKLSGGTSLQLRFEIFKPVEYDQLGQPGRGHVELDELRPDDQHAQRQRRAGDRCRRAVQRAVGSEVPVLSEWRLATRPRSLGIAAWPAGGAAGCGHLGVPLNRRSGGQEIRKNSSSPDLLTSC